MSLKVSTIFVFVLIFLLNYPLKQNVFFMTPCAVTASALEPGLNIESVKSDQRKVFENKEGNDFGSIINKEHTAGSDTEGLTLPPKVANEQDSKEKRTLRDDKTTGAFPETAVPNMTKDVNKTEARLNGPSEGNTDILQTSLEGSQDSHNPINVGINPDQTGTMAKEGLKTKFYNSQGTVLDEPVILTPSELLEEIDVLELERLQAEKRRTKDTLVLKYIEEDSTFDWCDGNVQEWLHFRLASHDYYIGRRLNDLLVIYQDSDHQDNAMVVNVGQVITSLECYTYWDFEQGQQEAIILIATQNQVLWYRNNLGEQEFELFGNWTLDGFITQIKYFSLHNKDYLVVCFNQTSLDIYDFHIESKMVKLAQTLRLESPCREVTLLKNSREVILAIVQPDKAVIYNFDPQEADYFQFKEALESPGLKGLKGFKIGGKNYLALAGQQSQILLYHRGQFTTKNLFAKSFGVVDFFLPIPLRTYRDDLMLLVQHRTLNLTAIEVLIWNGESFESSLPVPCHKDSQILYNGACMVDLEQGQNLQGAVVSTRVDGVSLIVPYLLGKSRLFHFHPEIMPTNSELLDLQKAFESLKVWVKERDDLMTQAQLFLATPEEELLQRQNNVPSLEHLETPELQFDGEVKDIFLNDYKWSKEDSELDLNFLINSLEDLESIYSSGRQRRELDLGDVVYEDLNFDVVTVEELEIENLNGSPFYIQNGVLDFQGEVSFTELEVLDKVVEVQKRQIEEDLELEGDLEFDIINGVKWKEFTKNMVLRNQQQELEILKVEGEVIVEDILKLTTLNDLAFPEDYLVSNGPRSSIVRAEKYFNNTLSVNSVDTDGLINGQNPVEAITLMDSQEWQGSPIFNHLEVSEILELNGTAHGRNVDNFPPNPTLQESNIIEAACVFNDLQVNGPIVLKGDLDGRPLGELLKNIIQKPEDPAQETEVPSPKSFNLAMFPIDFVLTNNTINQIPTESFVTVHTAQSLEVASLDGYVYFYNLSLKGLYDGINIQDVLKEVITLDKPLDLSTTKLIFEDELQAQALIVLDKINDLPIKESLQTLHEDLYLETAEFEDLQGRTIEFSQDIVGPGKLNNIELHDFVNERSWHEPPVQGNLFLNELHAAQGIQTDELHGINAEHLLDFLKRIEALPEMVLNGQIQVDHITVTGDVQVHKLNGLMFDEDIQMTAIWLNRPNHLSTTMTFKSPLDIRGNLLIKGNYQGRYMPDLMQDMVLREANLSVALITAPKSFLKPVYVLQNSQIEALNGIRFEDIALKTKENIFQGSVKVKGKLMTPDLEVQGQVNEFSLKDIDNILYYDGELKDFVLKGELYFENPISVQDLTVLGDFSDLPNLRDFFENLIYKTSRCQLNGSNTFTGRVSIDQGAFVHNLNGVHVDNLFQSLAFIRGQEPVLITSPVVFGDAVKSQEISVLKSLKTHHVNGCLMDEWLNNTLRVDQDQNIPHYLQFSAGSLDDNSLNVHFINDVDLSRIVTLNTPQEFNATVAFSEVYLQGFIKANGSVNGLNLEEEYNNTLMIYGGQHITTPLTIQSIQVLQDLQVLGVVNGNKDLRDVATLDDDLELQSPLYFQSLYSPQVFTKDLVTGIDVNKWFATSLKAKGLATQHITGNWTARSLTVKSGPNDFQYTINGFEPWQYDAFIRYPRSYNSEERQEICAMLEDIWKKIELKTVVIKHLEEGYTMDVENRTTSRNSVDSRRKLFHLNKGKDNFLLLNEQCSSHIFHWNSPGQRYDFLNSYESGPIAQVMVIPYQNSSALHFITNYESTAPLNCSVKGVNVWSSKGNNTSHQRQYTEEVMDLHKTNNSESTILILSKDLVREIDVLSFETKRKWKVYFRDRTPSKTYRFIAQQGSAEVLVTNGLQIVSLTDMKPKKKKTKKEVSDFELPTYVQFPSWLGFQEFETTSMLKPNASMARKFAFSDFKSVVERLLLDLSDKLNQQVNITQLSIPESDLFDEHLIPDFVAIMEKLQHQRLYSKEMLNISFDEITLPENPAQVLAASVIQIVWPVAEQLEEIHGHVRDNETHNHPLCGNITKALASLITEVLKAANPVNPKDYGQDLFQVIERIRSFDRTLHKLVVTLNQKPEDILEQELLTSASNRKDRIFLGIQEDQSLRGNSYGKAEILSLQVGSVNNPRSLVAVTKIFNAMTPGQDSSIHLYGEDLSGQPYQIINVQNPHSLAQFRLKQKTLLLFLENCCQVQILRYQGTQGFVRFANFRSDSEVQQIFTMSLPTNEGNLKHHLVLLTESKVKFYDIVVQGISQPPPNLPCP